MENTGELTADHQISDSGSASASSQRAESPAEPDYSSQAEEELEPTISRAEAIPVSISTMIDTGEYRSQMGDVTYHTLNGRLSPSYCACSSPNNYATLTPLQPLPPISTVSDKFGSHGTESPNVSATFTLLPQVQNLSTGGGAVMDMTMYGQRYQDKLTMGLQNLGPTLGATAMTMMATNVGYQNPVTYGYAQNGLVKSEQKIESPTFESYGSSPITLQVEQPGYPHNGLLKEEQKMDSPMRLQVDHPVYTQNGLSKSEQKMESPVMESYGSSPVPLQVEQPGYTHNGLVKPEQKMESPVMESYDAASMRLQLRIQLEQSESPHHSPNPMTPKMSAVNGVVHSAPSPSPHSQSPVEEHPSTSMDLHLQSQGLQQQEVEEINTKELAQRISSELKRYSIPQAVFAQRVLCRSQGTLSDLLRNPKPWSKLKSGRETFRRMWKWLQEPEFQRISALRLAASLGA